MRLPASTDTRLLVAAVAATVALVAYLGVAFADTHATSGPVVSSQGNEVAPWTPYGSQLIPVPRKKGGGFSVRVIPATRHPAPGTSYGALVPTLVQSPTPGTRFVVGLRLKAAGRGKLGVQIHVFRSGLPSRYLVDTTVRATRQWHRFTFRGRITGTWLGLAVYVYRTANAGAQPGFAIEDLTLRTR